MNHSRSLLLYQDEPEYGLLLKHIMVVVPGASSIGSFLLWSSGDNVGSIILLVEAFFVGLIFWSVFPRRYQVYEDHIRIVLGGPFSIKIGFDNIEAIRATNRFAFSVNFVTKLAKYHVKIARIRGMSISITPRDNDSFVQNCSIALSEWRNRVFEESGRGPVAKRS